MDGEQRRALAALLRSIGQEGLKDVLSELAAEQVDRGPTVAEIWRQYEPWGKANRRHWRAGQQVHWTHLGPWWGGRHVAELTLTDADLYRAARAAEGGNVSTTRNHEMSSLRACFFWALKRGLIAKNPLAGMEHEKEPKGRSDFLDEAGFQRLCRSAPNPLARMAFVLAFDTGMRRGELLALEWPSVDLEARIIRLGDGDVKNGTGRIVPLTDRVCDVLRQLPRWSRYVLSPDGDGLPPSTLNEQFRRARNDAGLPEKFTFHGLRHSCATLMRRRGVPWPLIKTALGWKTDSAARRYQQYNDEDWAQLRDKMNSGILQENRKGPLQSLPPENSHFVGSAPPEVKGATKK